jgi:peptidylprolyl isomerase
VLRRVRRPAAAVVPILLALALAGCGDDDGGSGTGADSEEGFDAVSIAGDVGKAPEVDWKAQLEADETETEVLVEGDGEEVEEGDEVEVNVWIGNGFTQEEAYTTYGKDGATPELFTVDDQLTPIFRDALLGQKIGSRVAVAAMSSEVFGEQGNPQMGIGNEDGVLLVLDLMKMYQPPEPKDVNPSRLPSIVEEKGDPVGLDFSGVPEPYAKGNLLRAVLEEGDGDTVTAESTVTADYLGMVYQGKEPFDTSFPAEPAEFSLQEVVQGWTYGLSGLKVGSRVILQIPPDLGYGAQEQEGIPANSTLYFVVDIVSAK